MDGFFSRFVTASKPPPPSFFFGVFDSVNSFPGDIKSILTIAFAILISLHIFWPKSSKSLSRKCIVPATSDAKWQPKPRFVKPKRFTKESEEFGEEYAGDMSSDDEEGDNNRVVVGPKEIPSVVKEMKEKVMERITSLFNVDDPDIDNNYYIDDTHWLEAPIQGMDYCDYGDFHN